MESNVMLAKEAELGLSVKSSEAFMLLDSKHALQPKGLEGRHQAVCKHVAVNFLQTDEVGVVAREFLLDKVLAVVEFQGVRGTVRVQEEQEEPAKRRRRWGLCGVWARAGCSLRTRSEAVLPGGGSG